MRRFLGLLLLLFFALPASVSVVVGCKHAVTPDYCPGFSDSGPVAGQITQITFSGNLTTVGESLNFGQIGSSLSASATDCFGTAVSVASITYGTSNMSFADINPTTGQVCAGTWNRNIGGGVADYSVCTAPAAPPAASIAYVTASAGGATSNPVPIYVHPVVTGITIGNATTTASCSATSAVTGATAAGSNVVTLLPPSGGSVPTLVVGQGLSGNGIPAGTTITTSTPGAGGTEILTLLYNATSASSSTLTGSTVAGSNVVSLPTLTPGVAPPVSVGEVLSGTGIAPGSEVIAVSAGAPATPTTAATPPSLTLLYSATATANTVSLTATAATTYTASVSDPSSNCCPANSSLISTTNGPYTGTSCVSQNQTAQLVAKAYSNGDTQAIHNITCQVGHITFSPQTSSSVVSIDANGIATAAQPGSTTILASVSSSGSGSTAGFFSTCPPASIALTAAGSTNPISVALNNNQSLSTTVKDIHGNTISGLALEFVSTSPQTLSAGGSSVTPNFPGTATVTAICQPGSCNPSPYSQIGYLGNGKPVTSNGLTVTTAGTSSNQVIVASTSSLFFYSVDFTTNSLGAVFKLPYIPNSMVITQDGSTLYLGSTNVLMSISAISGAVSSIGVIPGTVLAVSPDGSTLVITDPTRNITSLYSSSGGLQTTFNGIGQRAQFTPDSSTVYIAAGNQILVHSTFTGWTSTSDTNAAVRPIYQDVAVAVPAYGAYFAGTTEADGRTYCATSLGTAPSSPPPAVVNTFFPQADFEAVPAQRTAATSDGAHLLAEGFTNPVALTGPNLYDLVLTPAASSTDPRLTCTTSTGPVNFTSTPTTRPLTLPANSTFNGIVPASNSTLAFLNYAVPSTVTAAGTLPVYFPAPGTLSYIPLTGTATAPVAGTFSSDNKTFYTSTSGDNALHIITINGTTATDSTTIPLNLPNNVTGTGLATPNLIAQRVKKATS